MQVAALGGTSALPHHPLPHIAHPSQPLPSLPELAAAADAREKDQPSDADWRGSGDAVHRFGETAAAAGELGRFPGCEVMPLLLRVLQTLPACSAA